MAAVDELRQAIAISRVKLGDALAGAAGRWESGDDDGWSPRQIAEHCIGREYGLAGLATAALEGKEPATAEELSAANVAYDLECSLATANEASSELDSSAAACDRVFVRVEDRDLSKPSDLDAGSLPRNIEGVMRLAAWHLNDHAEQIAKA